MGAAADRVSHEASRYGQGLLTYALLEGIRGEALDAGGRLDVRRWFDVAELRVPELAKGIGAIQQPILSSPSGQSFPIVMVTKEDFGSIPLAKVKPQLVHVRCSDEDGSDPLRLEAAISEQLRALEVLQVRGAEPAVLYLNQVTGDIADTYTPRVRYITNGNNIHIRLRLERGEERIERLINLPGVDVSAIATAVAETFVEMAPTQ